MASPAPHPWLRVLYVDYSVGFGGATKSLSLVFRALDGVERYVLTSQQEKIIADCYDGARVFRFRTKINYRSLGMAKRWVDRVVPFALLRTILQKAIAVVDMSVGLYHGARIIGIVRRYGIDIIHLNNGFTPFEGMLAARLAGVPCVVHLRGFRTEQRSSHGNTYRRIARTITVSDAVRESLGSTSIRPDQIVTIYDPVDTDRFAEVADGREETRAAWGIAPDDVAVGIFGRVIPWKGQLEFVRSALEAMRTAPNLKAVIVGDESDGPAEYFEEVKKLIRASPFAERFVLTGFQPRVAEFYHAMDIVVHASIQPEPFGMVVPEAMAARRPIIAADAGGPREVVTPGEDGLLVPAGDVHGMAKAMIALASDPDLRQSMGEHGHAMVSARFTIARIAAQVMAVYRELVG